MATDNNKFLSLAGLSVLWNQINNKFATKAVATTSADGLMSKTDKANLDELVTLKPAEAGAQVNKVEELYVTNGTDKLGFANDPDKSKTWVIKNVTSLDDKQSNVLAPTAETVKNYVDGIGTAASTALAAGMTSTYDAAKSYTDGKVAAGMTSTYDAAKSYTDAGMTSTYNAGVTYTDSKVAAGMSSTLADAKSYADLVGASALADAKTYAQNAADTVAAAGATALAAGMTSTYNASVIYTDSKVAAGMTSTYNAAKLYADGIGAAGATALATAKTELQNQIDTLNAGATVTGSVDNKIAAAIDAIVDGATGTFDTFREVAEWIAKDETGAVAMSSAIAANTAAIEKLNGGSGVTGSVDNKVAAALSSAENYADSAAADALAAGKTFTTQSIADLGSASVAAGNDFVTGVSVENGKLKVTSGKCKDWTTDIANMGATALAQANTALQNAIGALTGSENTVTTPDPVVKVATSVTQANGAVSTVYTEFTAITQKEIEDLCI